MSAFVEQQKSAMDLETAEAPRDERDGLQRPNFAFAKRHGLILTGVEQGRAQVACRPDVAPRSLTELRRSLGVPLQLRQLDAETFDSLLRQTYETGSGEAMQMMEDMGDDMDLSQIAQSLPEPEDLLESEDDAPIIRLINALLTEAVKENASDIHIEPYEHRLVVRFRVDGVLREVLQPPRVMAPLLVSRIKVMAKLDIAEKRLPQDGRISLRIAGRPWTCASPPFPPATANGWCCACWTSRRAVWIWSIWACRRSCATTSAT